MAIALPKYALFDMDGTLIDNYEFHLKAWGEICEKYVGNFLLSPSSL